MVDRTREVGHVCGDFFEQSQRDVPSDHRRCLQSVRGRTWQEIDASRKDFLDRLGERPRVPSRPHRPAAVLANERVRLAERAQKLLDEERVSRSPPGDERRETGGRRGSEDAFDERVDARLAEALEPDRGALGGDLPKYAVTLWPRDQVEQDGSAQA